MNPIKEKITVFDFETTGLNPKLDKVIEIAAITIGPDGQIEKEFATLVKNGPITQKITDITGLTNADLENAMDEREAFDILLDMMYDSVLVAHNALFDLSFLHWTMERLYGKTFDNDFFDTLTISRERYPYPHKLIDMCNRYNILLEGAHRALNDVKATAVLLHKLHEQSPIEGWRNVLGYLTKYGKPDWIPAHSKLFGTSNRYAN